MSTSPEQVASLLQHLEEHLLQHSTRTNRNAVASLLTDDFREFGKSGRTYTKQQILDELAAEPPRTLTLSHFQCQLLSTESALVTYRSSSDSGDALRSSLWVFRDGRWQILFHQGTRIPNGIMT